MLLLVFLRVLGSIQATPICNFDWRRAGSQNFAIFFFSNEPRCSYGTVNRGVRVCIERTCIRMHSCTRGGTYTWLRVSQWLTSRWQRERLRAVASLTFLSLFFLSFFFFFLHFFSGRSTTNFSLTRERYHRGNVSHTIELPIRVSFELKRSKLEFNRS